MHLLLILLFFSFPTQAKIFQWIDAEGNSHYSDKPTQKAKIFHVNAGHSYYQVKKVYDGDTILLSNGQKIRFLGINTPEIEGRNKDLQAGGNEAKQWLLAKVEHKKVRLEKDVEKRDKYGRMLAHVFTKDNQHLNLELVRQGFASVNIYPPNLKYTDELVAAQKQAEQEKLGVWQHTDYKVKQVKDLVGGKFKGWQRVVGEIKKIHHTRKNSYLKFSDTFSLKVSKKSLNYFPVLDSYIGQAVEVNGWINKRKEKYTMFIRHSSAIKIVGKVK